MAPDSRQRLGTYRTPKFKIGQKIDCLARGEVVIIGMSNGRIQWPFAVREGIGGRSFVLYRDLARAVRRETNLAICHWWGVTPLTVSKWRRALAKSKLPEPSIIVASGGGFHLYWLLEEPYLVDDAGDPPPVETVQQGGLGSHRRWDPGTSWRAGLSRKCGGSVQKAG